MKALFLTAGVSTFAFATVTILTAPATATTLISSSGTWTNPVGGETTVEYTTVGDEAQILWGNALSGSSKSGLGYLGLGISAADISFDTPFLVGTLRHFNNPIAPPNVTAVDLLINLNLADVGGILISRAFTFNFAVDETTNIDPCVYPSTTPCADRISFLNTTASETFEVAGTSYTLELLGFSDPATSALVDGFVSQEGGTSTASLFGRLTAVTPEPEPQTTPEPGAIASLTLLGLYFGVRRRKGERVGE